jgi:tRNA-splicing ligase RtcB
MHVIKEEGLKVPIKIWSSEGSIEEGAIQQLKNAASLPFAFKQVVACPDCHFGFGAPIGGVLATKGVVIPNFVGKDIGCGMCAIRTSLTEISKKQLTDIMSKIRDKVPLGFSHQKEDQNPDLMPNINFLNHDNKEAYPIVSEQYRSALKQLGTLGGGNHFIEIQKGSDGNIWFMIHSGSRNLGKQVADHYNKVAKEFNELWYSSVQKEWDLAFLPMDTEQAKSYMREMNYCLEFAYANRKLMAERIKEAFIEVINGVTMEMLMNAPFALVKFDDMINIHHNYATWENHFGENVVIHRKGATSAKDGEIGLIPGSQGTASYVVRGKGNKESFMSCSHGAGRKMGRKDACRTLDLETEKKLLDDKGIIHAIRSQEDLDEAPGSYKDIDVVMEEQKDLVDIVVKLEPLAVIKG